MSFYDDDDDVRRAESDELHGIAGGWYDKDSKPVRAVTEGYEAYLGPEVNDGLNFRCTQVVEDGGVCAAPATRAIVKGGVFDGLAACDLHVESVLETARRELGVLS